MSKKRLTGQVVSDRMTGTVIVAVDVPTRHKVYRKSIKNTRKYKARDELGVAEGDTVVLEECRPFSKEVTWKVVEKLEEN